MRRAADRARGDRAGPRCWRSTPTSAGTSTRRSPGWRGSRRSTRTGSRSPRAPTTSSATRRSPAAWRPIRVATGEHVHNRVMFKQFLAGRARWPSARSTRAGWAASTRWSRCCCWRRSSACRSARTPAASACASSSSTSSAFDYIAVSGSLDGRMIEYVDHLHEHFLDPVVDPRRPLRAAVDCPATARRSGPSRWPAVTASPTGAEWPAVRRFGQLIRRPARGDRRVRAPPRRAVAGRPRPAPRARTSATTRSTATGGPVRLLRVRRRRLRGRHGARWPRIRRPSAGGSSPTRCRSRSPSAPGLLVARPPRGVPPGLGRVARQLDVGLAAERRAARVAVTTCDPSQYTTPVVARVSSSWCGDRRPRARSRGPRPGSGSVQPAG